MVPHSQTTIDIVPYIQSTPPPALFTPPDKTLFCCIENSLGGDCLSILDLFVIGIYEVPGYVCSL